MLPDLKHGLIYCRGSGHMCGRCGVECDVTHRAGWAACSQNSNFGESLSRKGIEAVARVPASPCMLWASVGNHVQNSRRVLTPHVYVCK